jgi:putative copper export protein
MADCCSPTFLFVLIRTVHFTACLLLLAVWAFDLLVLRAVASLESTAIRERWPVLEIRWTLLLQPLIGISGAAWFVQLCVNMSGLPLKEAMQAQTIRAVWSETNFGRLWQLRSILWLGTLNMPAGLSIRMPRMFRRASAWINLILAGSLVSSLAWAGHGLDGGPWHLVADAIHLFTAGLWPFGLAPFALLLFQLRKLPLPQRRLDIAALTFRFSAMSLISVALLSITGFINGLYMVGGLSNLFGTNYGRVLMFKFILFLAMMCFAAVNLIRLKPRLGNLEAGAAADASASWLQWNVAGELSLAVIVVIVTAVLGLLAPGHG